MSKPDIVENPVDLPADGSASTNPHWVVTVFNNEHNTYDEVIDILIVATGCGYDEAAMETWEIDHLGKSVVHYGDRTECEQAAAIIAQIGIEVRVSEE